MTVELCVPYVRARGTAQYDETVPWAVWTAKAGAGDRRQD